MHDALRCQRCAKAVPWVSFWGNFLLAVYKMTVGVLGQSAALIADAVHSFTDVVGSASIVVVTRVSRAAPDRRFPYGRGKAEFVGAVFVYMILSFFSVLIMIGAARHMYSRTMGLPHFVTALGALVSVIHNYLMYKYETCAGERTRSPAIIADAFENRADAISSVAAIVGILAALLIHPICDALAAFVVGVIIFVNCVTQLRGAVSNLMDNAMPERELAAIRGLAVAHDGVLGVDFLRSRQTGARFWVDLGLLVRDDIPVERADDIACAVRDEVKRLPRCHHAEVYLKPAPSRSGEGAAISSRSSESHR